MKYILFLLVTVIATTTSAQWEKVAWENATVPSIIKYNGDLYCATGADGVYRSIDGGASWETFNEGIAANHFALNARKIFSTSSHFLLLTEAPYGRMQLFRREKSGGPWQSHASSLDFSWVSDIMQIGTDTLVACAETFLSDSTHAKSGVYISSNGGADWVRKSNGLPDSLYYLRFTTQGQTICVSTVLPDNSVEFVYPPSGIFRSTDLGATWISVTQGLPDSVIFEGLGSNGRTIFADVYKHNVTSYQFDGIYRSTDDGLTWLRAMTGIGLSEEDAFRFIDIDSVIVVSMTDANYITIDDGATWQEFIPESNAFLYDAILLNGKVLLASGAGVSSPDDDDLISANGLTYSNDGFLAYYRTAVYAEDNTIFANLAYSGISEWIARSSDNGETWSYVTIDDGGVTMSAAPWDLSDNLMFAGGRNENNGRAAILRAASPYAVWTVHSTLLPTGHVAAFDVKGDSILAGVTRSSGVPALYFSTNNGVTWKLLDVPSSSKEEYVTVKFVGDNFLIFDDYGYTYLSTNGGITWRDPMVNTFAATSIAVHNSFAVAAGRNFDWSGPELVLTPDVYVSMDAGETWVKSSTGISADLMLDQIAIDIARPGIVYLSTDPYPYATSKNPPQSTIFVSGNNGGSWTKLGEDLPQASRLLVGTDYLFAASMHGLYRHPTVKEHVVPSGDGMEIAGSISAYPNPAADKTTVNFSLAHATEAQVSIYDELGRLVRSVELGYLPQGSHESTIDVTDLASGMYLVRLQASAMNAECRFTKIR